MKKLLLLFTIVVFLFTSCKKNDTPSATTKAHLGGLVEKGPFIRGSKVSIIELDNDLNPTGKIFETEIQNDEGFFELKNIELASKYIQVSVNGFYFNEITGQLSTSQISLGAFADVQNESTINTNILTHIEQRRVKYLISKNNMSFKEAKSQAQNEILKAFYIKEELNTSSEKMSITNNDENADILLAVSSAILNGVYSDAELTERISNIAENIEKDGHLNKVNDAAIIEAIENLPLERIKKNVFARYEKLGKEIKIGELAKYFTIDIKLPEDSKPIEEEDLFGSYENYIAMLNASMESFTQQLESYYLIEALYSNSTAPGTALTGNLSEIYNHNIRSSNSDISDLFSKSYQAIRRFNTIADHASESTDPKIKTLEYLTYPYLATIYWSMMEIWGDVAYITPANYDDINQSPYIARSTMNEVRTKLIETLETSVQNIEFGKTNLQVDKAFPLSVLVRLSLQAKDYSKAKLYAEQIINSNVYQLSSSAELHSSSKESIIGYQKNAFSETSGNPRINYLNLINKGDFIHAVRYTEIILAAAEASTKLGDQTSALHYLNQVRVRNKKSVFSSSNKEEILTAILLETKEDLGKEGLWFATLKRNGLAIKELNIPEYRLLFPIPQREIDLNPNMVQNPGY